MKNKIIIIGTIAIVCTISIVIFASVNNTQAEPVMSENITSTEVDPVIAEAEEFTWDEVAVDDGVQVQSTKKTALYAEPRDLSDTVLSVDEGRVLDVEADIFKDGQMLDYVKVSLGAETGYLPLASAEYLNTEDTTLAVDEETNQVSIVETEVENEVADETSNTEESSEEQAKTDETAPAEQVTSSPAPKTETSTEQATQTDDDFIKTLNDLGYTLGGGTNSGVTTDYDYVSSVDDSNAHFE